MAEEHTLPDAAPKNEPDKREPPLAYKRLSTLVALLLTFSAIFTLLSSWEEDISTNDANYAIITTEFNRTQATILSQSRARQNYIIYSDYLSNNTLYNNLSAAVDAADEDNPPSEAILKARDQAEWLAANNRFFFEGRYLKPDGSYDLERNIEEEFANIGRRTSLNSEAARLEASEGVERKLHFMMVTFAFGIATVIFGFETLFYWERRSIRFVLIAAGIGLFVFGLVNYFSAGPNPFIRLSLGQ